MECARVCKSLLSEGIYYDVSQERASGERNGHVAHKFGIAVAAGDAGKAREISEWEEGRSDSADDEGDDGPFPDELPVDDGPPAPEDRARIRSYARDWYPEDATEEVWASSGNDAKVSQGIEMALKENYIHCRCDLLGDRDRKIFVLPDDAALAREIVREILQND